MTHAILPLSSFTIDLFNNTINEVESLISQGRLEEGQYRFLSFMLSLPNVSEDDTLIIAFSMFNDGLSTVRNMCIRNIPSYRNLTIATNVCVEEQENFFGKKK